MIHKSVGLHRFKNAGFALKKVAIFYVVSLFIPVKLCFAIPYLDRSVYHSWEEVERYLHEVAHTPQLRNIVKLIPIGKTREGRTLKVLQISKKGIFGKSPHRKPATFIMGAHHAREHVSKETVLALIDTIITGYGRADAEGQAITYLVDNGTFYLLPWVNPDGGTNEYYNNPEQRKTNYPSDEPQIGAAGCDTCGDGVPDSDSPDLVHGDVGELSDSGFTISFADNGIIGRRLQLWYEDDDYSVPVLDERVARIQPGGSAYTFNYEGVDPDGDGLYNAYSGEDFIGGVDPNRNYGDPLWGECENDEGCSWLSGAQTYAGPRPFSEPETEAVALFLRTHPNIVSLESLHSGINEIYPPWWLYNDSMDKQYQDDVAQYISRETGYEVFYGGQYAVKGDTTGYSYIGSSQDPELGLEFFPGGILSFTTEVYGMGSDSGSAEAVKDWFPHHYQQFDTSYPQGIFIAWSDFPWCTTCNGEEILATDPDNIFNYVQYLEYFIFSSDGGCGGATDDDIFHCDYWGIAGSTDYYADLDIFAYFNPPSANRCYKNWNCEGDALVRTVNKNIKHLLYRLYIAPFIQIKEEAISFDGSTLKIAVENTGYLRSSIQTTARQGEDPFTNRYYDYGNVDVKLHRAYGFRAIGPRKKNIGWLGGANREDGVARAKTADFAVRGLNHGDVFLVKAGSDKTGTIMALVVAVSDSSKIKKTSSGDNRSLKFKIIWTNQSEKGEVVDTYFNGDPTLMAMSARNSTRAKLSIDQDMDKSSMKRKGWKQIEGPVELIPGYANGIIMKKYHE